MQACIIRDWFPTGPPELSPRIPIHDKLEPRLGDDVTIRVINVGYPYPTYNWTFYGQVVGSHDKHFESDVELRSFKMDEFGDYTLTMTNDLGEANHTFTVEANGRHTWGTSSYSDKVDQIQYWF